jgi:hypothetical protein
VAGQAQDYPRSSVTAYRVAPWAAGPVDLADFAAFFFLVPDGHGDGADDLDGTMNADSAVLPDGAPEAAEGVGVLADPGSGVVVSDVDGVGLSVGGVVVTGGVETGVLLAGGGDVLGEVLGDGEVLPEPERPDGLHVEVAADTPGWAPPGPVALGLPVTNCEPPPFSAELPVLWADPSFWLHGSVIEPLEEMACGSVITAKAPAATTKMAVPIAATGRSQP